MAENLRSGSTTGSVSGEGLTASHIVTGMCKGAGGGDMTTGKKQGG